MQGILISLATAVILAIGGAFAAPYVVDWNAWRGSFESEMSQALGLPVVIRGPIDARILPAPRLVLRDVTLGDVVSTGGTVKELDAELSLGSLMRGDIEATGVRLIRPQMRLVLDSAGAVTLPTGSGEPANFSIARLEVENGALDLLDRGTDRTLSLTDLDLRGEARSLSGPFRLDGEVEASGVRFGLRSTLGNLSTNGTGRLRLILDGRTTPFGVDLDGTLGFNGREPHYEGRAALSRKGAHALETWQLSGQVRATPTAVVVDNMDLALGGAATPAQLSGSARLSIGRAVGLDAVLNARSLDLDSLSHDADGSGASPTATFARFLSLFADLPAPQASSKVGVAVDQLMLGGTLVRNARADVSGGPDGWRIDNAEAELPGAASLQLSGVPVRAAGRPGAPAQGSDLSGEVRFSADDPTAFLRWAAPDAPKDYLAAVKGPVRLSAKFAAAPGRMALKDLDGSFAEGRVTGALSAALPDKGPPSLDINLALQGFELDPIIAAMRQAAASVGGGADAKLALNGQNLTFAGLPLGALALQGAATGGSWRITRLVMDNLAGIHLEGAGWMENFSTQPRGELNLSVTGVKADGLVPVARLVAGEEAAKVVARLVPVAAPVKLTSSSVWSEGGGRRITADGTLGQLEGSVTFARTSAGVPLSMEVRAQAADASRTLAALGIDRMGPRLGAATGQLTVSPLADGQSAVKGNISVAGLTLQGEGTARLAPDGTLLPDLALRLDGADLGRLLPQVAAAVDGPAPAALSFGLMRTGPSWKLQDLTGSLAGAPLTGTLTLVPGTTPQVGGRLAFNALSLPRLIGLFGARAPQAESSAPWSAGRFAPRAVADLYTDVELFADRLSVLGPYALTGAQFRLVSDGTSLEVRNLTGAMGEGRAALRLAVRPDGDGVHADGRLTLDKVDAAFLTAPAAARTPPAGRVSLALDLGGSGRSPAALVQSLAGQGTVKVDGLRVEAVDPGALARVLAETEPLQPPPDERRTAQLLDRALEQGPLVLPAVESTFGVVNGVARLSPARTQAQGVAVTLNGSLDLARLDMEAQLELEGAEVAGGIPGGTVNWRGPVANPQRRVSATALTSVVALRAIERETRRLEERRATPVDVPQGAAARPAPELPAQPRPLPQALPAPAIPAAPRVAPPPAQPVVPQVTPRAAPQPLQIAPPAAPQATAPATPRPAPVTPPRSAVQPPPQTAPRVPASDQIVRQPAPPLPAAEPQAARPPQATLPPPATPAPARPAPQQSFGVGTAPSGGGAATPANRPGAGTQNAPQAPPPASRTPAREEPERAPRTTRPPEASAPRYERPQASRPVERRPLEITPAPPPPAQAEPVLPPTRGFGDLPRPPGLVGGQ